MGEVLLRYRVPRVGRVSTTMNIAFPSGSYAVTGMSHVISSRVVTETTEGTGFLFTGKGVRRIRRKRKVEMGRGKEGRGGKEVAGRRREGENKTE